MSVVGHVHLISLRILTNPTDARATTAKTERVENFMVIVLILFWMFCIYEQ